MRVLIIPTGMTATADINEGSENRSLFVHERSYTEERQGAHVDHQLKSTDII